MVGGGDSDRWSGDGDGGGNAELFAPRFGIGEGAVGLVCGDEGRGKCG